MSTLLRRFCTCIDDFHERRPVIAILIAIAVAIACEIAISFIGGDVMPPVITRIGGFSA
jgi:hypothetical protein